MNEPVVTYEESSFEEVPVADSEAIYFEQDDEWNEADPGETHTPSAWRDWAVPVLAGLVIIVWSAFFAWTYRDAISAGAAPAQWVEWVGAWSVPVLLVVALWLLVMRNSRRESARFADAASALSRESRELEERLLVINRELSLAREFLGTQSLAIESVGRVATERLSEHADHLAALVHDNDAQIDRIANVSLTARENMEKLRGDLPVIANSARDVASSIGQAGDVSAERLDVLVDGFRRLNSFGEASERQVTSFRGAVDEALSEFETQAGKLGDIADSRFAELRHQGEEYRLHLDGQEIEALAAIRHRAETMRAEIAATRDEIGAEENASIEAVQERVAALRSDTAGMLTNIDEHGAAMRLHWEQQIDALSDRLKNAIAEVGDIDRAAMDRARSRITELKDEAAEVDARLEERTQAFLTGSIRRREESEAADEAALATLTARLADFDSDLATREEQQIARVQTLSDAADSLGMKIAAIGETITRLGADSAATGERVVGDAQGIEACLAESRANIELIGTDLSELTDGSVRLLELIQASSQHGREKLPEALTEAEARLSEAEDRTNRLHDTLVNAVQHGSDLSNYVLATREAGQAAIGDIDALQARVTEQTDAAAGRVAELRGAVAALADETRTVSDHARIELQDTFGELQEAMHAASTAMAEGTTVDIRALAGQIGEQAGEALQNAVAQNSTGAIADLEAAALAAASSSREATAQLRDQLAKVNELTGNLESRVARAREQAEEQVNNDFSRRVALITESLNSHSIDIEKTLAIEVDDTSWASYLRGDRGIFTRRAVRLLENSEARDIAEVYDEDADFRENVSRYIHDFEAMLRTLLSTRDGHAIGVTLLSSDIGKLYVALAQAIERLREA
ncbi:coiled-coil domain-containing protein [Alteripontixanthobacter maritimus]|uniref:ATPase n=1 Tax=Alteripontixanthobacter maritimus TaxID=2161824 RepID=UPI0011C01AF4|nr:ATPase [Alteripontixanthobacter maritimus]